MKEVQRVVNCLAQGIFSAEDYVAVIDNRACLADIPHIRRDMEGHGPEITADHRVKQDNSVPYASQRLLGSK